MAEVGNVLLAVRQLDQADEAENTQAKGYNCKYFEEKPVDEAVSRAS